MEKLGESPSTIDVTVERQYFNMVYSALITTERATAKRLGNRGFDAAVIQAQVAALTKQLEDAKKDQQEQKPPTPNPGVVQYAISGARVADLDEQSERNLAVALSQSAKTVQLDLAVLKPKLETCALRAQGAGS
jgi:hypothetical protein